MSPAGGLKLRLCAERDDRRTRYAQVSVTPVGAQEELVLVTDAAGRMAYRLDPGEYRLRVEDLPESGFVIGDRGWTTVRLSLD